MGTTFAIPKADINALKQAINLENKDFASAIMKFLKKYQVLSDADISIATSREQCSEIFHSSYPMLLEIIAGKSVFEQVKDPAGRSRFYATTYLINNRKYVMTRQLYR